MPALDFTKIGEGGGIFVRPLMHDGVAYFGACDKYFYAVDANTGAERWSILTGGLIMSSAALEDGMIFFGCFDNNLYAVPIKQKQVVWKFKTGGIVVSSPVVEDNVVYFGSCDTHFYAVSAKSREILWKFKTGDEIFGNPLIEDNRIFFGSSDHHLYCLGIGGSLIWKFRANGEFLLDAPHISGETIYAADSEGWLYALDKNTGISRWKFRSGEEAYNCISSDDKNVYFGSRDRYLYALDKKTGALLWKFRANMGMAMSPLVTQDRIYVGSDKVYALDKKGNMDWAFKASESEDAFSFSCSPVLYNGKIYYTAFDGHMRCLDMDGNLVWGFRTKSPRGVKLAPGALKPVSWWDEKMFSVFEGGVAVAPPEAPQVLKKYGVDALAFLEEKIENPYASLDNIYGRIRDMKYVDSPATYVHKTKKKKDEVELEKLFRL